MLLSPAPAMLIRKKETKPQTGKKEDLLYFRLCTSCPDGAAWRLLPVFPCCWGWEAAPVGYVCLAENWCSLLEVRKLLRTLGPFCNICIMLPLRGRVNWEAAEVLVGLQHAQHRNWSVWLQCSRNQNQKESFQVWQEEIRDVPQSWRRNLLFPHYISHLHHFPLLLDMLIVCHSLALSSHLQTFFGTCTSFPAYKMTLSQWQFCSTCYTRKC